MVRGPEHGPVADAAGPSLIVPAVAVPEALASSARWALLTVIAAGSGLGPRVELSRTADLLDATALACHPGAETFLNPGVNIAEYLGDGTPLLIGSDLLADSLAAHGARVLADVAGVAAAVVTAATAAASPTVLRRAGAPKDLFADPFDDDDEPAQRVKPLLVSTTPESRHTHADPEQGAADRMMLAGLLRSFTGAMALDGSPDSLPVIAGLPDPGAMPDGASFPLSSDVAPAGQPADAFDAALAACLRLDFAAVYLGMATGQLVPLDFPDGLGRAGGIAMGGAAGHRGRRADARAGHRYMELMENRIRPYGWGSRTAIAELTGAPSPAPHPQAELWMGAHPGDSSVLLEAAGERSLLDAIADKPVVMLGERVEARFGPRLPFLFKVLAAAEPLSLQAHPSAAQAARGLRPGGGRRAADGCDRPQLQGRQPQAGDDLRVDRVRRPVRIPGTGPDRGAAGQSRRSAAGSLPGPAVRSAGSGRRPGPVLVDPDHPVVDARAAAVRGAERLCPTGSRGFGVLRRVPDGAGAGRALPGRPRRARLAAAQPGHAASRAGAVPGGRQPACLPGRASAWR